MTGMIFKYLKHKLGFLGQEDTRAEIFSKWVIRNGDTNSESKM